MNTTCLNDLIIFAENFEEHLQRLDLVLIRLKKCQLKLAPEKCFLFQKKVKVLGHIVTSDDIHTDPDKIEKVQKWPLPADAEELRSFLPFAGYYRRFVKDFSKITRPFNVLLSKTTTSKKNKS